MTSLRRCCDKPATANSEFDPLQPDPVTAAAPHWEFNTDSSQPTELFRFTEVMEQALGREALKNFQPMQPGDEAMTAAETKALEGWMDFRPSTSIDLRVQFFSSGIAIFQNLNPWFANTILIALGSMVSQGDRLGLGSKCLYVCVGCNI